MRKLTAWFHAQPKAARLAMTAGLGVLLLVLAGAPGGGKRGGV